MRHQWRRRSPRAPGLARRLRRHGELHGGSDGHRAAELPVAEEAESDIAGAHAASYTTPATTTETMERALLWMVSNTAGTVTSGGGSADGKCGTSGATITTQRLARRLRRADASLRGGGHGHRPLSYSAEDRVNHRRATAQLHTPATTTSDNGATVSSGSEQHGGERSISAAAAGSR